MAPSGSTALCASIIPRSAARGNRAAREDAFGGPGDAPGAPVGGFRRARL